MNSNGRQAKSNLNARNGGIGTKKHRFRLTQNGAFFVILSGRADLNRRPPGLTVITYHTAKRQNRNV
jgi:hypothetical protein